MLEPIKGDNFNLAINVGEDITNWKIRAELYDCSHSIQKASANSGGSTSQVLITDVANGKFTIRIVKGETTDFEQYGTMEVEVEDADGEVFTILQEPVTFHKEKITWAEPS